MHQYKQIAIFILLLFSASISFAQKTTSPGITPILQYYPNGKIHMEGKKSGTMLIDTLHVYNKDGSLKTVQIFQGVEYPRQVFIIENLNGAAAKRREGYRLQTSEQISTQEGVWKYYWKNGMLMDSVIYKNDSVMYRARFNKNGKLQFEN